MDNNVESHLSRADKEKFNIIISKVRENILEFKEYFFMGKNKKVFVVRSIRWSRFCIFNNNINFSDGLFIVKSKQNNK